MVLGYIVKMVDQFGGSRRAMEHVIVVYAEAYQHLCWYACVSNESILLDVNWTRNRLILALSTELQCI